MTAVVVGGGSIGSRHIRNLVAAGERDVICVKRRFTESYLPGLPVRVKTSVAEALLVRPEKVFVCNPTACHVETLEKIVSACTDDFSPAIFMEKPLIHTREGLEKARQVLSTYSGTFFIGFMMRYHEMVVRLKKLVEAQHFGPIYSAQFNFGSYMPGWHLDEDYRESYASRSGLGGGVLNTLCHEVDLVSYFFGWPDTVVCHKTYSGLLEMDVESSCDAVFGYSKMSVGLHLNFLQKRVERSIVFRCQKGEIRWDWTENVIRLFSYWDHTESILTPSVLFDVNQLYMDELRAFNQLVESQQVQHPLDHEYAIRITELMVNMHESATMNQTVRCNIE